MPTFSPAIITIMRGVLEEAMTKVPAEQATTVTKAYLAEVILKAAAEDVTSYEGLMAAVIRQLPTILFLAPRSVFGAAPSISGARTESLRHRAHGRNHYAGKIGCHYAARSCSRADVSPLPGNEVSDGC
jgi:hypothetical protein